MSEYNSFVSFPAGRLPFGIHMYALDKNKVVGVTAKMQYIPISHSNKIFSVVYVPYLTFEDFTTTNYAYDKGRYQFQSDSSQITINSSPRVYKIDGFANSVGVLDKHLKAIKVYKPTKSIGGSRSWRNESKLYNYPYSYGYLSDGFIKPTPIYYDLCPSNDISISGKFYMTPNMDYEIYIPSYANDDYGRMENITASGNRDLPTTSSQYTNWYSTNKNQIATNTIQNVIGSTVAGGLAGGVPGALVGGAVSTFSNITKNMAMQKDMANLPNTLISSNGDVILNLFKHDFKLHLFRYRQNNEYMERLGDYFAMYGYKQNKILKPNLKSRYYYNYIKTIGANIKGNGIPKNHLDEIKNIFDNGTTIWHINNSGVTVGDYSKDNYEV